VYAAEPPLHDARSIRVCAPPVRGATSLSYTVPVRRGSIALPPTFDTPEDKHRDTVALFDRGHTSLIARATSPWLRWGKEVPAF
jgi:hypothetical protein